MKRKNVAIFNKLDMVEVYRETDLIVKKVKSDIIEELSIEDIYKSLLHEDVNYLLRIYEQSTGEELWPLIFSINEFEEYYEVFLWCKDRIYRCE